MFTASKILALLASLLVMALLTLIIVTPRGEADTPSINKVEFRLLHEAVSGHQIIDGQHQKEVLQVVNTIPEAVSYTHLTLPTICSV